MTVLRDDLGFFPRYEAILLYRLDAEQRWPAGVRGAANARRADRRRRPCAPERTRQAGSPARAPRWRRTSSRERFGVAATPAARRGRWTGAVLERTREHLMLVGLSLLAAILVALPLGIVAARRPRLGQLVLAAVGVVQTIPSLALLVFMIPLFGIGALPAIAALFLYSLLPIVRNTHAGLVGIAPAAARVGGGAGPLPLGDPVADRAAARAAGRSWPASRAPPSSTSGPRRWARWSAPAASASRSSPASASTTCP